MDAPRSPACHAGGRSASLSMHDGKEVFVTSCAGLAAHRPDEAIEAAPERADAGLYEAKRSGKNRARMA